MFVCGGSGSGKTSMVYEPLIARDLDRKFFSLEKFQKKWALQL